MEKRKHNKGSTMVEVLIGFAILMILVAGLTQIIHVSTNMLFSTKDLLTEQENFVEQLYQKDYGSLDSKTVSSSVTLKETDKSGKVKSGEGLTLDDVILKEISNGSEGWTVYQFELK